MTTEYNSDDGYDTVNEDEFINETKETFSNRSVLRKLFSQISRLRCAINNRNIYNRLNDRHIELRRRLLKTMKLPEDTNKKVYLNYITTRNYFTDEECNEFINEARLIEQAYLTTIQAIDYEKDDCIAMIYPGRYNKCDEDFYFVITDPKSECIWYLENLRESHRTYGANIEDFGEGYDDPIDNNQVISFRHA